MHATIGIPSHVRSPRLKTWVMDMIQLCKPDDLHWCDGSQAEYDSLCELLVKGGTFKRLNPDKRPGCFLATSDPGDVARVEGRTFICSINQDDAGPTNNWVDPREMKATLSKLFDGSMRGRTMYVVPFSMGPIGSPISYIGYEISDSAYVAVNMKLMTRMGRQVDDALGESDVFVPCLHSVGMPLAAGQQAEAVADPAAGEEQGGRQAGPAAAAAPKRTARLVTAGGSAPAVPSFDQQSRQALASNNAEAVLAALREGGTKFEDLLRR